MATGEGRKRKPKGKPDNPAQSKRFIEAARARGADTSTERFEENHALDPEAEGQAWEQLDLWQGV